MKRFAAAMAAVVLLSPVARNHQLSAQKVVAQNAALAPVPEMSRSDKFFIGFGIDGNGMSTNQSGSNRVNESGGGGSLTLGWGFSPRWSIYGEMSGADMKADGGGTYGLAHVDLGARVHFRAGPNTVVPFLQFGVTGRGMSQNYLGNDLRASGGGVSFGGGLNAHINPAMAFSTAVTWTVGKFSSYQVNGVSVGGGSVDATSARLHLGLVFFP
jgi:Outer membrane protein beta-barrel domain